MQINYINTGTSANAGNGDSIRSAFTKVNANFQALVNDTTFDHLAVLNTATIGGILTVNTLSSTNGTLSLPNNMVLSTGLESNQLIYGINPALITSGTAGDPNVQIAWLSEYVRGYTTSTTTASIVRVSSQGTTIETNLGDNNSTWQFGQGGVTTFPGYRFPSGSGSPGQVLSVSNNGFDLEWNDQTGGTGGSGDR